MPQSTQAPPQRPLSSVATRLLARARREWEQRQFDAAEGSLNSVLALAPDCMDALRMLGMVAQRRGNHAKAADCFRRVLAAFPQDDELHVGLGIALFELARPDEALAHFRQATALAPKSPMAWFNLGEALGRHALSQDSVAALRRAIELDPAHASARLSLARVQASLGQVNAAVTGYREVVRRDPDNAEGWFGLSNLNTVHFDTADTARMQHALARPGLAGRDYELLAFSYAKALENQGEHAQAYDVFERANTSRRQRV
jgi:tetratricopeptide (TPR) repeat protein